MPGVEIITTAENTLGFMENGPTLTASIRVRMDSKDDTGVAVMNYIIANGYDYGSEYNVGNDHVNGSALFQIEAPEYVQDSQWLWDVKLHYIRDANKNDQQPGSKKITDLRPKVSVGTIQREKVVEKAFYRGGINGPGGSWNITINDDLTWRKTKQFKYETPDKPGDGSFSECVGLYVVPDRFGRLSAFPVGHPLCPPIQNSANAPYNPPPTRQVTHGTINIERNTLSTVITGNNFPVDWINSRPFILRSRSITMPIYAYTMKILRYRIDEDFDNVFEIDYVKVVAEFEINPEGWRRRVEDAGTFGVKRAFCDPTQYARTGIPEVPDNYNTVYLPSDFGGKCTQDFAFAEKERGQQRHSSYWMNGDGKRLDEDKKASDPAPGNEIKAKEDCFGKPVSPVVSIWSDLDEIDPFTVPFLYGLIHPMP